MPGKKSSLQKLIDNVKISMPHLSMKAENFAAVEILFRLAEQLDIKSGSQKLYELLSGEDIVYDSSSSYENKILGNAKRTIAYLGHSKIYHDILNSYLDDVNVPYRMYDKDQQDTIIRNPIMENVFSDRIAYYDDILKNGNHSDPPKTKMTSTGRQYKIECMMDKKRMEADITIPKIKKKAVLRSFPETRTPEPITVRFEDILGAADKIDTLNGTDYMRKLLEGNVFSVQNNQLVSTDVFQINGTANMAGQVSAGKTKFSEALSVALMDSHKRVLLIKSNVPDVLETYEKFKHMGYQVVPIIGKQNREKHIREQKEKKEIARCVSDVLQRSCMLYALAGNPEFYGKHGAEPCHSIYTTTERIGESGETITRKNKFFTCSLYDICPVTELDRTIPFADMIVTTIDGLCYYSFGKEKQLLFEYVLKNIDCVMADESDEILCKLDNIFSESFNANDYSIKCGEYIRSMYCQDSKNKHRTEEEKEFRRQSAYFDDLYEEIRDRINNGTTGWNIDYDYTFSITKLVNKMNPENGVKNEQIPIILWNPLERLTNVTFSSEKKTELLKSIKDREENNVKNKFADFMAEIGQIPVNEAKQMIMDFRKNEPQKWEKLMFLLYLIAFVDCHSVMSSLVKRIDDVPAEIRKILNGTFKKQQQFLPNAPTGNLFTIKYNKQTQEISLIKQHALGRALLLSMSKLVQDENGNAAGPNVLLMSGTGYLPGSFRHHIMDRVDYVIQASKEKRDFIAHTTVFEHKTEVIVSGISNQHKKLENLQNLAAEIGTSLANGIARNQHMLLIVNSYEQCSELYHSVIKELKRLHIENVQQKVAYLPKPEDDSDKTSFFGSGNQISRKEISDIASNKNLKILVAPAVIIGRGYNIVDSFGNAFFDCVFFFVRPLPNPFDPNIHIQSVNSFICAKYFECRQNNEDRIQITENMRKDAYNLYNGFHSPAHRLSELPERFQINAVSEMFVTINQVFGRLCRLGEQKKERYPSIYFVDGAFSETLVTLEKHLEDFINRSVVAKTLYEPIYQAIKKRR